MPLGDSITEGKSQAPGGYRLPLYNKLTAAGDSVQFVGSQTTNPGSLPADQQNHEGHSGAVIAGYDGAAGMIGDYSVAAGYRGGLTENIGAWLGPNGAHPDVILLMIGTNDVFYDPLDHLAATAPDRLSNLISLISNKKTGLDPSAALIVAQVTPDAYSAASLTQAYNAGVASVVANHHDNLHENVSLVNMYSALDPATDFLDGEHPNSDGYLKMADVWLTGMRAAGVIPAPEPGTASLLMATGAMGAFAWSIKAMRWRTPAIGLGKSIWKRRPLWRRR